MILNKFKTAILLSFLSTSAYSVECDFNSEKGIDFTFEKTSPINGFRDKSSYQDWFAEGLKLNLDYDEYFARDAKLSLDYIAVREKLDSDQFSTKSVRYYPAIVDNCKTVYLRVDTSDKNIFTYLDPHNWRSTPHPNFRWEESRFNIMLTKDFNNLVEHEGKFLFIKPLASKIKIEYLSKNHDSFGNLEGRKAVRLLEVDRLPFVKHGVQLSPYRLLVETENGVEVYIPWDPEYLSLSSYYVKPTIREGFIQDIKDGNIRYGMNKFEVEASWGRPELVRRQVVMLEPGMGEFVVDDLYPYAKTEFILPTADSIPEGVESDWYYSKYLPKDNYLVFDKFGLLKEYNQTFRINRSVLEKELNNIILPAK